MTKSSPKLAHQLADLENKWKRALADYQNLEKRITSQQTDFVKFACATFVAKLLPIIDDLQRATIHLNDSGLNLILSHLQDILKTEGIIEIAAQDHPFDPSSMEAVETVAGKKDMVIAVVATGYQLHDKILRPARVTVGKG